MPLREYTLPQVSVRLRLEEERPLYSSTPIDSADRAVSVMENLLRSMDRETVCCINLDTRLRPINFSFIAVGGLDTSIIDVPNVFKTAILNGNTASIIMMHNHPSGATNPSRADIDVTKRISLAGQILDIPLVDHIIVGCGVDADPRYSFRENIPELFTETYNADAAEDMLSAIQNNPANVADTITDTIDTTTIIHGRSM